MNIYEVTFRSNHQAATVNGEIVEAVIAEDKQDAIIKAASATGVVLIAPFTGAVTWYAAKVMQATEFKEI